MLKRALLIACGLVLPTVLLATPIDPGIIIDAGDPAPIPITSGINQVQPTGGLVIYDFINDTGVITSFDFQTTINSGLSAFEITSNFSCSNPSGYFLGCSIGYDPIVGLLSYDFSGIGGPFQGIPTGSVFHITLDGWTPGAHGRDGTQLYSGLPVFVNSFTAVPEPSAALLLTTGLGLLALMARRARARQSNGAGRAGLHSR